MVEMRTRGAWGRSSMGRVLRWVGGAVGQLLAHPPPSTAALGPGMAGSPGRRGTGPPQGERSVGVGWGVGPSPRGGQSPMQGTGFSCCFLEVMSGVDQSNVSQVLLPDEGMQLLAGARGPRCQETPAWAGPRRGTTRTSHRCA